MSLYHLFSKKSAESCNSGHLHLSRQLCMCRQISNMDHDSALKTEKDGESSAKQNKIATKLKCYCLTEHFVLDPEEKMMDYQIQLHYDDDVKLNNAIKVANDSEALTNELGSLFNGLNMMKNMIRDVRQEIIGSNKFVTVSKKNSDKELMNKAENLKLQESKTADFGEPLGKRKPGGLFNKSQHLHYFFQSIFNGSKSQKKKGY